MPNRNQEWFSANQWLTNHYPNAVVSFRSDTLLALFECVKTGLGVGPLPFFLGEVTPQLKLVMQPAPEFMSELWLLTHPDLRRTARVRAFVDFIKKTIKPLHKQIEGSAKL